MIGRFVANGLPFIVVKKMGKKLQIKKGERYGKLVITKEVKSKTYIARDGKRHLLRRFLCKCDCGNEKIAFLKYLRNRSTTTCGCWEKHGMTDSRVYHIWSSAIQRCSNPKNKRYSRYGGRGIKVCKRWLKFENFYKDMGDKPDGKSLERINNNKGYSPSNCRWATIKEQQNNMHSNRNITYKGITKTLSQWAEFKGINKSTLAKRISRGWSIKRALKTF
jgi:hypothetical protein